MQGGDHKKWGRGDGGGGELLFRPKTNHIMFNIPQQLVFGQSRPVPPGGMQGGTLTRGRGGDWVRPPGDDSTHQEL